MAPPLTIGWVYNLTIAPPSTEAPRVIAITVTFSTVACFCIILRFAVRWRLLKKFGLDDYAAACSAILGVAYTGLAIAQTRWGLGLDGATSPKENVVGFSRIQYIGGPVYCLAILGFKISLLASYLRVAGFNRNYRIVLYVVMSLVTINQILYTCLLSFACNPIRKQWDFGVPGHCIDAVATYYGLGGSSLGFDILVIILPFPILRRLQLDTKKKFGIGALYGLGFFISVIQIVRMNTIGKLTTYTDSLPIILWSAIEINLGVVIACIPTYAPLFRSVGSRITKAYDSKASRNHGAGYDRSSKPSNRVPSNNKSGTFASAKRVDTTADGDEEVELWPTTGTYGYAITTADGRNPVQSKQEGILSQTTVEVSDDGSDLHAVSGHYTTP